MIWVRFLISLSFRQIHPTKIQEKLILYFINIHWSSNQFPYLSSYKKTIHRNHSVASLTLPLWSCSQGTGKYSKEIQERRTHQYKVTEVEVGSQFLMNKWYIQTIRPQNVITKLKCRNHLAWRHFYIFWIKSI